jgi:hypothetical protein
VPQDGGVQQRGTRRGWFGYQLRAERGWLEQIGRTAGCRRHGDAALCACGSRKGCKGACRAARPPRRRRASPLCSARTDRFRRGESEGSRDERISSLVSFGECQTSRLHKQLENVPNASILETLGANTLVASSLHGIEPRANCVRHDGIRGDAVEAARE